MKMSVERIRIVTLIASVFLVSACNFHPDENKTRSLDWTVIGPGGGGGVLKPTISPFNENFVLTHCDMTGVYVTTNGGQSWKMKNLWNVPDDFEFDPSDSNTVYIATRGFLHSEDRGSGISLLLRSDDKGEKWRIIYPDVTKSKKVERLQSTSLIPSELMDGAVDGTIQKVKVDPADNRRIYLGMAPLIDYMGRGNVPRRRGQGVDSKTENENATLVISTDHGTSWKVLARLPGRNVKAIFPQSREERVTVITEQSCVRINEKTGDITSLPLPVSMITVAEGGNGKNGSLIYIQSDISLEKGKVKGGIYVSNNMGESWTQIIEGLLKETAEGMTPDFRQGFAVCESEPEVAYVSVIDPIKNEDGQTEAIYCIYKTTNAGKLWEPVLLSSTPRGYITNNFSGSWMEQSFDPGWGGSPIDLGVAPGNPDVCYAGDNGRGYKTMDGGRTWVQVYSHNNADGSYSSSGLDVTTCYGIHFDPFDRNHFFICYTDIGLFHTFDGGKSWFHSINGVPRDWQNTCYDLVFDPDVKGRIWSVWANAHDLPRTKMFGDDGFASYSGGIAVSEDAGRTWHKTSPGLPENSVCTGILLDKFSSAESRILYVSVFDGGIYKSSDGGKDWKPINNGLEGNLFAWQVRQNSNGRLFALFARGQRHNKTVAGAIFSSDDRGESWQKVQLPESITGPHDLLIDPVHPEVLYVSCWPHTTDGKDTGGGIIKTADGGLSWKQTFDDRIRVNSAGMDPLRTEILYINTFQNAAYRSDDAGSTWKRIEGYRFKWGQRAIPDIHHPGMLYLTTYGGSVYYGPASGIPDAPDDVLNMPDGWW